MEKIASGQVNLDEISSQELEQLALSAGLVQPKESKEKQPRPKERGEKPQKLKGREERLKKLKESGEK